MSLVPVVWGWGKCRKQRKDHSWGHHFQQPHVDSGQDEGQGRTEGGEQRTAMTQQSTCLEERM